MAQLQASELTLNDKGRIYHLDLLDEDIADNIILVGDPGRVELIAAKFTSVRFKTENREFVTMTGEYKGKELTVISTGIGTDNIDIVLTELDAIANIDLKSREIRADKRVLNLVRIGTCGALINSVEPGDIIRSEYAIGMDGLAHFYEHDFSEDEGHLKTAFIAAAKWDKRLNQPYVKSASKQLNKQFKDFGVGGITLTANGFYGPQGRALRLPLRYPNQQHEFQTLNALTICLVVANRNTKTFLPNYHEKMDGLINQILDRLTL